MIRSPAWEAPVLRSVVPVVAESRHVATDPEAVAAVARWIGYEPFERSRPPGQQVDFGDDPDRLIDVTLLMSSLNFAFTDFDTGERFETDYAGHHWCDAEAMAAGIHRSVAEGVPLLDGEFLAEVTADQLDVIFSGTVTMPMLEERAEILNAIGATLVDRYRGAFHRFVRDCAPAMYAGGDGLLERLVSEFPRFDDRSGYHGHVVELYKLGQLCLWSLHLGLSERGEPGIADLDRMTAFADYVVPLALRVMGVLRYTPELDAAIDAGDEIPRDSDREIEIRAHTVYATALLTDAINEIRPADLQIVIPQLDYRLWDTYHTTFKRHHLTRTIMY